MIPLRESAHGISFAVRVQPRAERPGIRGIVGEGPDAALKLGLAAPPVDGRANQELVRFFAEFFHVPQFSVEILSGAESRNKIVRIQGLTIDEVRMAITRSFTV